jgi:hypothetical protein
MVIITTLSPGLRMIMRVLTVAAAVPLHVGF